MGATAAGWHSIESFFRCFKEGQYRIIRKIKQPLHQLPDALGVGLGFHAARARWFGCKFQTDDKTWEKVRQAMEAEWEAQDLPVSLDARRRTSELVRAYMDHWARRVHPTPIAAEYALEPTPVKQGDPFWLYRTARLDDLSRYPEGGDALWIGEAKTTSGDAGTTVREYELHGQPLLQLAVYAMSPNGARKHGPVKGVMLDVIKKPYGNDRAKFDRVPIEITDRAVAWFIKNLRGILKAAAQVDWNADVPRNITACTRMIGRMRVDCEFKDLCRFGRSSALRYVYGPKGDSLAKWTPNNGDQEVPPWE